MGPDDTGGLPAGSPSQVFLNYLAVATGYHFEDEQPFQTLESAGGAVVIGLDPAQ